MLFCPYCPFSSENPQIIYRIIQISIKVPVWDRDLVRMFPILPFRVSILVLMSVDSHYNFKSEDGIIFSSTSTYLAKIVIPYPFLPKCILWSPSDHTIVLQYHVVNPLPICAQIDSKQNHQVSWNSNNRSISFSIFPFSLCWSLCS